MAENPHFPEGVALVIGGSGGLGTGICKILASYGANVSLTYNRSVEKAEATAETVRAQGCRAETTQLDLRDTAAVAAFVEAAAETFGQIHTAVYASGPYVPFRYLGQVDPQQMKDYIEIESMGFFNLVHAVLPHLRKSKGSIVACTSIGLERWPARDGLSVIPKAAVAALVQGVAREEGGYGVRANSVCTGTIEAGLFHTMQEVGDLDHRFLDAIKQPGFVALRRNGKAEDIGEAVAFLASSRANFITGQVLKVDGGYAL